MKDVTLNYRGVATWGSAMVQYPVDGDRHYLKYRKDVLDNPENQKKFKEKTGRDLAVPKTWEEYDEVASFFNNWDWAGDGKPHFGSAEVTKRDDLMFSAFISRAAAYAKNPNVKGELLRPEDDGAADQHPGLRQGVGDVRQGEALLPAGRRQLRPG